MQEIKHDGSEGIYKEGDLKDLLKEVEHSMEKPDVKQVIISKAIPGRKKLGGISEDRIREVIREELEIMRLRDDPLFKRVLEE